MLVDDLIAIIKYGSMWFGIWLALCLTVTVVTVIVQLINKKLLKKKPIHWEKISCIYSFLCHNIICFMEGLKAIFRTISRQLACDR